MYKNTVELVDEMVKEQTNMKMLNNKQTLLKGQVQAWTEISGNGAQKSG